MIFFCWVPYRFPGSTLPGFAAWSPTDAQNAGSLCQCYCPKLRHFACCRHIHTFSPLSTLFLAIIYIFCLSRAVLRFWPWWHLADLLWNFWLEGVAYICNAQDCSGISHIPFDSSKSEQNLLLWVQLFEHLFFLINQLDQYLSLFFIRILTHVEISL